MTLAVSIAQSGANNVTMRNRIINGNMMIDQRNAGASVTGGVGYTYPVDRFKFYSAATSKLSGQRSTTAPANFTNSLLLTSLAATTPSAGDEYELYHNIEGFNVADLGWGTASAQPVTLSFNVRSSLTGTFAGCIANSAGSRSYVFTYTITSANTFEQKIITIPGDTSGTWATDNTTGMIALWDLGSGSNYNATAGAWNASFKTRTSGSVNIIGTNGATWYITGVQLEEGTTATAFEQRLYGTELALCQRYYQHTFAQGTAPANGLTSGFEGGAFAFNTSGIWFTRYIFPVVMRAAPSITLFRGNEGTSDGLFATYDAAWTSLSSTLARQITTQGAHLEGSRNNAFTAKSAYLVSGNFTASAEL